MVNILGSAKNQNWSRKEKKKKETVTGIKKYTYRLKEKKNYLLKLDRHSAASLPIIIHPRMHLPPHLTTCT